MGRDPELESLLATIPNIINGHDRILLYVGASVWRAYLLDEFIKFGYKVDVLEIWPKNVDFIAKNYPVNTILGDVRTPLTKHYDAAIWWHGPEHIPKIDLSNTLSSLEARCSLVVIACPKGDSPQGEAYGNPYECHIWSVSLEDLTALGYSASTVFRPPGTDAILAYKGKLK